MAAISWNLEQIGPNSALHTGTTQDMCVQDIIGIYAKLRVPGPEQRFDNTFRILLQWRRLQTNRTHIGPTLHVGPNKDGFHAVMVKQFVVNENITCENLHARLMVCAYKHNNHISQV